MPKINNDPISPAGIPLHRCTQADRHAWIYQLADVEFVDPESLMNRPEWPRGFEIDPLEGFTPGAGAGTTYRVQYRERSTDSGYWLILDRVKTLEDAAERAFIVACVALKVNVGAGATKKLRS